MSEIPPSTFVPCEVPLPGGVLVLAPLRRFGLAAPEAKRDGSVLRRLWGHPEAFARLRRDWSSLDLGSDPYRLSPQQIMLSLETAMAAGRLGAAFFPWVITSEAVLSAAPAPPVPVPTPASSTVLAMSHEERIGAMLKLVPAHLKDDALKNAFLQLITPAAIGIMVASFVVLLVGHAVGYGEVADVALAAFAYTLAGLAGIEALYNMIAAVWNASTATTHAELDAAANRFAVALAVLGVTILLFLVSRSRSKAQAGPREPPPEERPSTGGERSARPRSNNPNRIGAEGEAAVRGQYDIGPKVKIDVNGRARIPDGLTDTTLSEVKNVSELSYTQQLRDFADYAKSTGRDFDLYVRPDTELSGPLLEAIQDGTINLKLIPSN